MLVRISRLVLSLLFWGCSPACYAEHSRSSRHPAASVAREPHLRTDKLLTTADVPICSMLFNVLRRLTRSLPLLLLASLLSVSSAEDRYFNSGDVKLHYTVEGTGEPVILVHGFAGSIGTNWRTPGVVKGLSDAYQVIALDNRGHGQSEKPHNPAAYGKEMVDDVIRLMDHLNISKAHIVGYSRGGVITQ